MPKVGGKRARVAIGGLVAVVAFLGLTACGGSSGTSLKADIIANKINSQHRFDPDKFKLSLGQDNTISVLNKDKVVHNFTVSFLGVDQDIQPGQRVSVKIPAVNQKPDVGYLTFYCKYHQSEGMTGRLEFG